MLRLLAQEQPITYDRYAPVDRPCKAVFTNIFSRLPEDSGRAELAVLIIDVILT